MATKNQTKDQEHHWPPERTEERALLITVISRTLCSCVLLHSLRAEGGPGAEGLQLKMAETLLHGDQARSTQTSNSLTHKTQLYRDVLFTETILCAYLSE